MSPLPLIAAFCLVLLSGCGGAEQAQSQQVSPASSAAASAASSPEPSAPDDPCAALPIDEADLCYAQAEGGDDLGDEFGNDSGGQTDLSKAATADLGLGLTLTKLVVRVGNEDGQRRPTDPEHAGETYFHLQATVRNDSTQPIDLSELDAFTGVLEVLYGVNEYEAQGWATAGANDVPRRIAPGTTVTFVQDVSLPMPVERPIVVVFDSSPLGGAEHRLVGVDDRFTV